jgi:four helix bundle protein
MTAIIRFEDIEAWKTARELTRLIYEQTQNGQFTWDFGLSNQMRQASVSIMSNIAEGFESLTSALFTDYLGRAKASAGELRAQLYIALDIGYITETEFSGLYELCDKYSRQVTRFMQYLANHPKAIRDDGIYYEV